MKRHTSKIRPFFLANPKLIAAVLALTLSGQVLATGSNGFNSGSQTPQAKVDPTQPVSRGYIVPSAEPIPGGARVSVEIFHAALGKGVSLWLQAAVNDGKLKPKKKYGLDPVTKQYGYYMDQNDLAPTTEVIPLKLLSDNVSDNPTTYYSDRKFDISYDEINAEIAKLAPNSGLKVGPGTPLYVYAKFHNTGTAGSWDHQWGGQERGGLVLMPLDPNAGQQTVVQQQGVSSTRAKDLDIGIKINQNIANLFNDRATGAGLKLNGQIRSRLEAEGKFQLPVDSFAEMRKNLFEIANDTTGAKAQQVFGPGWKFTLVTRYLQKDKATGQPLLDKDGYVVPAPMVDTYYDDDNFRASEIGMAIRWRQDQDGTGMWNFKPGMGIVSDEGVAYRIEFGADATDSKPETVMTFADSSHPLNFFSLISQKIPGAKPSEFLKPAVEVADNRYKFLMEHSNGLKIELSLDQVTAKSLRDPNKAPIQYLQLEADIEHLATQSNNAGGSAGSSLQHKDIATVAPWLQGLDGGAYFDGAPVMHSILDLDPTSPVRSKHNSDFVLATDAIKGLTTAILGPDWMKAPQKAALAAYLLDHTKKPAQGAVGELEKRVEQIKQKNGAAPKIFCSGLFSGPGV